MTESTKKRKRRGERPDKLIQLSASDGFDDTGKRLRKWFYGKTRSEAAAKRDAFKRERARSSRYSSDISVAEWVDVVLLNYRGRVNPAYKSSDAVPFNRIKIDMGSLFVADVVESDLQESLNRLEGKSFSTVEKYLRALQLVFSRAQTNKIIYDNPAAELVRPKSVKGTHRALERWEVDFILLHWNDEGMRAGLWVLLMLLCGLRRGEMIALEWSAVNLPARSLSVRQTAVVQGNRTVIEPRAKSDAGLRTLPICDVLFDALSLVPVGRRCGYVCARPDGSPLTEQAVRKGVASFCDRLERVLNGFPASWAGVRRDLWSKNQNELWNARRPFRFQAHDLRHTFATALYDANVPAKAAQYFLGHSDIKLTLNLYTHLSREREAASRLQMVEYFNKWLQDKGALTGSADAPLLLN